MAERVRRSQDDDGAARSPHAPLRHRRNRKRKLALQKSRLTSNHPSLKSPRFAPAAQPRPAPPGRMLLSHATPSWGPYSVQIWGPVSVLIDTPVGERPGFAEMLERIL